MVETKRLKPMINYKHKLPGEKREIPGARRRIKW